eukprot:c29961_g1_i1 orf=422-739(-)
MRRLFESTSTKGVAIVFLELIKGHIFSREDFVQLRKLITRRSAQKKTIVFHLGKCSWKTTSLFCARIYLPISFEAYFRMHLQNVLIILISLFECAIHHVLNDNKT